MWHVCLTLCFVAALTGADNGAAPFIKPCSTTDNACIVQAAQAAVAPMAAGIPSLGIQPLDPMKIDKIVGNQGGLELLFTDTVVTGMKGCKIESIKHDPVKGKQSSTIRCSVSQSGQYSLGGQLLVLPIQGRGKYTLDIRDIVIKTSVELKTVTGNDGKQHWQIGKWRHSFIVQGGAQFHFQNLFNGNTILSDAVHQFANSNWRDVMSEIAPPIIRVIVMRVVEAVSAFYDHVPLDQLSLDYPPAGNTSVN